MCRMSGGGCLNGPAAGFFYVTWERAVDWGRGDELIAYDLWGRDFPRSASVVL
jgi:hypothetical protein